MKPVPSALALWWASSVYISLLSSAPLVIASSPRRPVSTGTPLVDEGRSLTTSVLDLVLVTGTVAALRVTDIFTFPNTSFRWCSSSSALVLQGPPLLPEKGFWFALTCVCSLYMLLKTLMRFHKSNRSPHRGNVEQVQAPDQSNRDKSVHNQNMSNKEGLQIDRCRSKYKALMFYTENG